MGDYLPKHKPGQAFTITAGGAVVGGNLVNFDGTVSGADSVTWAGVAAHDAASGAPLGVYAEGVQYLVASAAISAGARVKCAASGQIVTFVDGTDVHTRQVGIALEAAAGAASVIAVKMIR